jgi:hypothetical protein
MPILTMILDIFIALFLFFIVLPLSIPILKRIRVMMLIGISYIVLWTYVFLFFVKKHLFEIALIFILYALNEYLILTIFSDIKGLVRYGFPIFLALLELKAITELGFFRGKLTLFKSHSA